MINYKNILLIFATWTIASVFSLATPDPPHPLSSDILLHDHVNDLIPELDHVSHNHTLVKRGLINSIFSDLIEPFILYDVDELDKLAPGECMYSEIASYVSSSNPDYSGPAVQLCMQMDCNLVIYKCWDGRFEQTSDRVLWSSDTARSINGECHLVMQQDGNLVVYDSGNHKVWSYTDTPMGYENGPYRAVLQGDGNFVVYRGDGTAVWDSAP